LQEYEKAVNKQNEWTIPFSILVTALATILTAQFQDMIFSKETWRIIYNIVSISTCLWLVKSLVDKFKYKKQCSLTHIIDQLAAETEQVDELKLKSEE
jgi:positive regulator of sigma E activity